MASTGYGRGPYGKGRYGGYTGGAGRPYGIGAYGVGPYSVYGGNVFAVAGRAGLAFSVAAVDHLTVQPDAATSISFTARAAGVRRITERAAWTEIAFSASAGASLSWTVSGACETGGWQQAPPCQTGVWQPVGACEAGIWTPAR
jgi:hypothetical protein